MRAPRLEQSLEWTLRVPGLEQTLEWTLRTPGLDRVHEWTQGSRIGAGSGVNSEGSRSGADSGSGLDSGEISRAETDSRADSWVPMGVPILVMSIAIMRDVVNSRTAAEALMLDLTARTDVRDVSSNLETSLKCLGVTLIAQWCRSRQPGTQRWRP